jgi:hypothetical protein
MLYRNKAVFYFNTLAAKLLILLFDSIFTAKTNYLAINLGDFDMKKNKI